MTWEDCHEKLIQELGRVLQGVDWNCCQCIKKSSKKSYNCHLYEAILNQKQVELHQMRLTWATEKKRSGASVSGLKYSFQIKVNSSFHLEIKVLDSVGRGSIQGFWSPVWRFGICDDLRFHLLLLVVVGLLCFVKSKVNTAICMETSEHFMLPSVDTLYEDLSAKTNTKSFADHLLTLLDWPVISSDLRATENLLDWWKTPEPKIKRAEGRYQSRRCFNNISATQSKYQLYKKDYCQQL